MNDFTLGDFFGGSQGFMSKLKQQGFSAIEALGGPTDLAKAKLKVAQAPGNWTGPWSEEYPWEVCKCGGR